MSSLGYARGRMGWVIVGMDKLGKASDMSKDLNKRKLQFKRILDRVTAAAAVLPSDLVSHARGLELLEARFGEPLPAAGRAVTAEEFRDLVSLANRVSWDARNAHLRATAVRWYLEALIHDVEATLHDKVVLSDLK
ncbi:Os11g0527600 [Oryza sativa Japonica Group]|uniref:Os11g0527600 protein n=1 Tax=Oryza sativa subsp. japonica TaxID=39947 RepID=A0A0P0Y319_ORYSJ|nr:Os11g0527600 [Oryza sativa Japonica Group]